MRQGFCLFVCLFVCPKKIKKKESWGVKVNFSSAEQHAGNYKDLKAAQWAGIYNSENKTIQNLKFLKLEICHNYSQVYFEVKKRGSKASHVRLQV